MERPREKVPVRCVLGLGSNRRYKDLFPAGLVNAAAEALRQTLVHTRLSPLYKTAPLHVTDQAPFVNAALCGFFLLDGAESTAPEREGLVSGARRILRAIHAIEAQFGRNRALERRWGERSLDIDILLFGDLIMNEADLTIPHPRLRERVFALRPLLDLLPDAVEPGSGNKYGALLESIAGQEDLRIAPPA